MAARRREVPILRARTERGASTSRPPPEEPPASETIPLDYDPDELIGTRAPKRNRDRTEPPRARPVSTVLRTSSSVPPVDPRRLDSGAQLVPETRSPSSALKPGWSDDLLVGHPKLDRQHKRFFLHALRLAVACEQDRGADEIEAALTFLHQYAEAHFAEEEAIMREVEYPYFESHAEAHDVFLAKLSELEREVARHVDKRAVALDLAYMASGWFAENVRQVDRVVARFLADHG
jgi:hemerythrin